METKPAKACRFGHEYQQSGCNYCKHVFKETYQPRAPEPRPNVFLGWLGASIAVFAFWWVLFALATWTW